MENTEGFSGWCIKVLQFETPWHIPKNASVTIIVLFKNSGQCATLLSRGKKDQLHDFVRQDCMVWLRIPTGRCFVPLRACVCSETECRQGPRIEQDRGVEGANPVLGTCQKSLPQLDEVQVTGEAYMGRCKQVSQPHLCYLYCIEKHKSHSVILTINLPCSLVSGREIMWVLHDASITRAEFPSLVCPQSLPLWQHLLGTAGPPRQQLL